MLTIPFSKASTRNIHDAQKDFGNNCFNSFNKATDTVLLI